MSLFYQSASKLNQKIFNPEDYLYDQKALIQDKHINILHQNKKRTLTCHEFSR